MFWKIVLKGTDPSGRVLAVLYARSGETIDSVRRMLASPDGMVLQSGISRERARILSDDLPNDGSVQIYIQHDNVVFIPVLMGYRPGSRGRLRAALQKLSRLPTEEVIRFLASIPIALKSDADKATAESIKKILERAGGIVEIRSPDDIEGVSTREKSTFPNATPVKSAPSRTENSSPLVLAAALNGSELLDDAYTPPATQYVIPPVIDLETGMNRGRKDPYIIRFTVPAASIPAVVSDGNQICVPPEADASMNTILIYLYPVAEKERERVQSVLCRSFEISQETAEHLITNAPAALAGFSERIDALVTLSELADLGVPVSLIPGSSDVAVSGYDSNFGTGVSPGTSFFRWLNGK